MGVLRELYDRRYRAADGTLIDARAVKPASKGYNPGQPRHLAGTPEGGQFAPSGSSFTFQWAAGDEAQLKDATGGRIATAEQAARCAGAQPGSAIRIEAMWDQVHVFVQGEDYFCNRVFKADGTVRNVGMRVDDTSMGAGLGTRIFAQQVNESAAAGFTSISTQAAGGPGEYHNGYYTWPRFGYNTGGLLGLPNNAVDYAEENGLKDLSDFMRSPEHRDWWRKHGSGVQVTFDLTEGSLSRRVLDAYVKEKQRRAG